jgi:glucosylceramidase
MKLPTWEDPKGAEHASKMTYSAQPVCLRDGVGPDSKYARAWALYFSKFVTAYKNLGLPMWAVTVQNEPEFPAPWEACSYTPETQQDFVRFHLGPRLREDQPIYYYMGHISRYVRPGSVAVMGLATQALGGNRIFRPEGQVVAGGGQNDLARDGIELTVWPCEGSTRQQFTWDVANRQIQVHGHDWLGHPTKSCVGRTVDTDLKSVLLTSCTGPSAGVYEFVPVVEVGVDTFNVVLQNHPKKRSLCLVIAKLENNGGAYGPLGGAQVALGTCDDDSARWRISQTTGEAMSTYFADSDGQNEVCLTTGWPFLQMGAFATPTGEASKTVVVLNEAGEAANYAIQEGEAVLMTCTIPPRSIQTVLIE